MSARRIALPTPERLREQPMQCGGWSQFFDAVLAALDHDEAREPATNDLDRNGHRVLRDATSLPAE